MTKQKKEVHKVTTTEKHRTNLFQCGLFRLAQITSVVIAVLRPMGRTGRILCVTITR